MLADNLLKIRKRKNYTQQRVADYLGITRPAYTAYEKGNRQPDYETLKKLSALYDVTIDYLLGNETSTPIDEIEKEEKDIAKRMEQIRKDLSSEDGLLFNGEPMSDEAVESFLEAMEYAVRQTQRINKKYIPKKYRDKEQK
ncbi:helix-turn-helix domain-containing protein [Sutcliffiella cohnii]